MKYILIFLSFLFYGFTQSMDVPDTAGIQTWHPLTYDAPAIMATYKAFKDEEIKHTQQKAKVFLAQIPNGYAILRDNVLDNPEHFTRDFFTRFCEKNVYQLKEFIKIIGWPDFDKESAEAAWMVAQQAIHDNEFQHEALAHLNQLIENPENSSKEYLRTQFAYLYDLILINNGMPQFYATQYDENFCLRTIDICPNYAISSEQAEIIHQRRSWASLKPLPEYLEELQQMAFAQNPIKASESALPS